MTSLGRIQGFNEAQVKRGFQSTWRALCEARLKCITIFNIDETGVPTVPTKLPKIISAKGAKRVAKVVSAERGRTITLICSMNAEAGSFIPPAFAFPRKKTCAMTFLAVHPPPDSVGFAQKSAWMTQELFAHYLEYFVKHTRPSQNSPVLMILDNHVSHLSIAAVEYCRQQGVIMLTMPPHSSHMIQPLDVTFFGPFKTYYSQACDNWVVSHPGRPITEYHIGNKFTI